MKAFNLVLLLISIILCSCFVNSKQQIKEKKSNLLKEWRTDSLGCLQYRTKEKAFYIRDSLDLIDKTNSYIIDKLGNPNSVRKDGNVEVIKYYFNTVCRENLFIDSLDYCWVEMLFEKNHLKNIEISCY